MDFEIGYRFLCEMDSFRVCGPVGDKRVDCCHQLRQLFVCFEMTFSEVGPVFAAWTGTYCKSNIGRFHIGGINSSHPQRREIFEIKNNNSAVSAFV